jgi:hypothetical protein
MYREGPLSSDVWTATEVSKEPPSHGLDMTQKSYSLILRNYAMQQKQTYAGSRGKVYIPIPTHKDTSSACVRVHSTCLYQYSQQKQLNINTM